MSNGWDLLIATGPAVAALGFGAWITIRESGKREAAESRRERQAQYAAFSKSIRESLALVSVGQWRQAIDADAVHRHQLTVIGPIVDEMRFSCPAHVVDACEAIHEMVAADASKPEAIGEALTDVQRLMRIDMGVSADPLNTMRVDDRFQ